jgi:hypothetical protein
LNACLLGQTISGTRTRRSMLRQACIAKLEGPCVHLHLQSHRGPEQAAAICAGSAVTQLRHPPH